MEGIFVAQFDLNSNQEQVLAFKKGDRFIPLTSKRIDENWRYGVDLWGNIGYIPLSYVKQEEVPTGEFLHIVEVILDTFGRHGTGTYTRKQRDAIQELSMRRTLLLSPIHSPNDAEKPLNVSDSNKGLRDSHCDGSAVVQPNITNDTSSKIIEKMEKLSVSSHSKLKEVEEKVRGGLVKVRPQNTQQTVAKDSMNNYSECQNRTSSPLTAEDSVSSKSPQPKSPKAQPKSPKTAPKSPKVQPKDPRHEPKSPKVQPKDPRHEPKSSSVQIESPPPHQQLKQGTGDTTGDHTASQIIIGDSDAKIPVSECSKCSNVDVPTWLVPRLVENVRHKTQLSHKNSKVTIGVVLDTLQSALPGCNLLWNKMKYNLDMLEVIQEDKDNVIISEDHRKLLDIFKKLWCCKNDEQQRSWPVHEDETLILSLLHELNTILMDADPKITTETVRDDDYELVNMLATYYQMEPRRTLRVKMLQVFVTLCKLDISVVSQLLMSILPMELARDMQCTCDDIEKLEHSAYVLTIIFSTGQKPPNAIFEFVDNIFLNFLFDKVELFFREDDEDIGSQFLSVLLAVNIHFKDVETNLVFSCLEERHDARMLTEKLVFYVNREEDPIRILENGPKKPNSVLKFLVDFFAFPDLVDNLFYLNDVRVLLDIIVRQLTDYLPGEEIRQWYLLLVKNVVLNSCYEEHFHQQAGLQKCFRTILAHQEPCMKEVLIVKEIIAMFPTWFDCSF